MDTHVGSAGSAMARSLPIDIPASPRTLTNHAPGTSVLGSSPGEVLTIRLGTPESRRAMFDDIVEEYLEKESHHVKGTDRARGHVTRIVWHYSWLMHKDPNEGNKERSHHVCKLCSRCVLRRSGSPGDKNRMCLYCQGYDSDWIPAGYSLSGDYGHPTSPAGSSQASSAAESEEDECCPTTSFNQLFA